MHNTNAEFTINFWMRLIDLEERGVRLVDINETATRH